MENNKEFNKNQEIEENNQTSLSDDSLGENTELTPLGKALAEDEAENDQTNQNE